MTKKIKYPFIFLISTACFGLGSFVMEGKSFFDSLWVSALLGAILTTIFYLAYKQKEKKDS